MGREPLFPLKEFWVLVPFGFGRGLSLGANPDLPKGATSCSVVLFVALCLTAALLPAVAQAHPPEDVQEPYEEDGELHRWSRRIGDDGRL